MAVVVSDTSPIRALAHIQRFDLLRDIFGQVLLPPAVVRELRNPHAQVQVDELLGLPFVQVQAPTDSKRIEEFLAWLDPGESEAIALALETRAAAVLIDESAGRAMARRLGVEVIGVLGILLRGKQKGLVHQVAPLIDRLEREIGFFISDSVRHDTLRRAGECT